MQLMLCIDHGDAVDTTLDAFLSANEFDPAERDEIRAAVDEGRAYVGGGGAAPEWVIGAPAAVGDYLAST